MEKNENKKLTYDEALNLMRSILKSSEELTKYDFAGYDNPESLRRSAKKFYQTVSTYLTGFVASHDPQYREYLKSMFSELDDEDGDEENEKEM